MPVTTKELLAIGYDLMKIQELLECENDSLQAFSDAVARDVHKYGISRKEAIFNNIDALVGLNFEDWHRLAR